MITGVSGGVVSTTKLTLSETGLALPAASTAMTVITWLPVASEASGV
ncbi:hypothetical protein I137_12915 [Salmonella enterica subsp. enterica serovar Pullorum str. S06004]|nr:hypothetical protein I137_12915 [Salmonella enterica subsp. enterica serovar Pullorum str. S06004]VXG73245.1 hypothetical protein CDS [Salmonella enterica subsp. enterica serovar Derby]